MKNPRRLPELPALQMQLTTVIDGQEALVHITATGTSSEEARENMRWLMRHAKLNLITLTKDDLAEGGDE